MNFPFLAFNFLALARYGEDYVSSWNFESWNEPDHHDFDGLNFTVQSFLNYYDACSEGLYEANPQLLMGGPGASCRQANFSHICWALLAHCNNGTNYLTHKQDVKLDFISFHHKVILGTGVLVCPINSV